MDIYAIVTDKIVDHAGGWRCAVAQAVDLCRTAAQSRYEKALSWHQPLFVIREQVCLAILVDAETG